MPPLLVATDLTQRSRRGSRSVLALHHVSLAVNAGEFVAIRAQEPLGRRTLTLVLGGHKRPDSGSVTFDGTDLYPDRPRSWLPWRRRSDPDLLPGEIAVCWDEFAPGNSTMLEHVALPARLRGATAAEAKAAARAALERTDAEAVRSLHPTDVEPHDLVRAGIARAIVLRPRVVLLNDLTSHVGLHRDPIVALMRSLAINDGAAVVFMAAHIVPGCDRALDLFGGTLRGRTEPAPPIENVMPLRRAER